MSEQRREARLRCKRASRSCSLINLGCYLLFLSWHVDAAATATVGYFCYTEASDRTLERTLKFGTLAIRSSLLQALLSAAAGSFGASLIDLFGMLCRVGQYRHGVLEHFEEAT